MYPVPFFKNKETTSLVSDVACLQCNSVCSLQSLLAVTVTTSLFITLHLKTLLCSVKEFSGYGIMCGSSH